MAKPPDKVIIHTDGACRGNPGAGGWGALLHCNGREKTLRGGEQMTTNNRMELRAAIEALNALRRDCRVELYTDSRYLRDGVTEWLAKWKSKNWKTSARKPVKNRDLWEQLDELTARHQITWRWVRAHTGDPGNERADQLARLAIDEIDDIEEIDEVAR